MCHSIYSPTLSYVYCDIHKFRPTPYKLNSNPTFLASKTFMGCRDYILTNFVRKKDHVFMPQRYKYCVYSSNGFKFNSETSQIEEIELGLEFSKENEDADSLQVYDESDADEFQGLNFDGVLNGKAKDGVSNSEDEVEEVELKKKAKLGLKSRKNELIKRSNLLAKQVIGVQSALSLGFVSQLWVDTTSWVVLEIEVRPSLLSSESGKVLLEDVERVGDVVLVQDETFVLNGVRTVGLETLVGYSVVTRKGRQFGKVRGFTFNINSGAVEFLELDAFGNSLIPSSMVSTYALCTEDVLQVVSDTIIVHETAASRIQRVTKGFFSTLNPETSNSYLEYDDLKEESVRPKKSRRRRRKSRQRKSYPGKSNLDDDLDLPMDYM